jgi:hypothetical protein
VRAGGCLLAPGFGAETRMTIDAARRGSVREIESGSPTERQDATSAASSIAGGSSSTCCSSGPLRVNYRGVRLPLVGWLLAVHEPVVIAIGLVDDLWSGPERGFVRTCARAARPAC